MYWKVNNIHCWQKEEALCGFKQQMLSFQPDASLYTKKDQLKRKYFYSLSRGHEPAASHYTNKQNTKATLTVHVGMNPRSHLNNFSVFFLQTCQRSSRAVSHMGYHTFFFKRTFWHICSRFAMRQNGFATVFGVPLPIYGSASAMHICNTFLKHVAQHTLPVHFAMRSGKVKCECGLSQRQRNISRTIFFFHTS